jgi:hypothetical protein
VKSDLCDFDTVVSTVGISGTKTYDVPAPGEENIKTLALLTEVSGWESDDCEETTYWTLDVQLPRDGSPTWEPVWNSTNDYEDETVIEDYCWMEWDDATQSEYERCAEPPRKNVWISKNGKFHEIHFDFNQTEFVEKVQTYLETSNTTVRSEWRVALRDEKNRVIAGPTANNMFTLMINGQKEYTNPCAGVDAIVESKIERDFSVSFNEDDQWKDVQAKQPIVIRVNDTTKEQECKVFYKLYAMNEETGKYMEWQAFAAELEAQFGMLESHVSIDTYGNFEAGFTKDDIEKLRDVFTDANGEASMKLRVKAGIVGSDIIGPANLDALKSKDFKIEFISNDKVATCASASLAMDSMTKYEPEQRGASVDY